MTPDELAGIQQAFSQSLQPMMTELRGIHAVLHEHSKLLQNIDGRLVRVEGLLDGVEILVRSRTRTG
jgi:hypothetical protein